METLLVRLRPYDPRRGCKLRRYTCAGIRFQWERGWYRVEEPVAEHLRRVHAVVGDQHSPPAFDVCTDAEAQALDAKESDAAKVQRRATDDLEVVPARSGGAVTTADLSKPASAPATDEKDARRKRERG